MHGTKAKNEQLFADEQTSPAALWKELSWLENKRRVVSHGFSTSTTRYGCFFSFLSLFASVLTT